MSLIIFLFHLDSGRYVSSKKYDKLERLVCSDGLDIQHYGRCLVVYRFNNEKDLDIRTIHDDISFDEILIDDNESILSAKLRTTNMIFMPTCDELRNYGKCKSEQRRNFLHGLDLFEACIQSKFLPFR